MQIELKAAYLFFYNKFDNSIDDHTWNKLSVLEGDICLLLNDSIVNLLGTVASHELSFSPVAQSEKKQALLAKAEGRQVKNDPSKL